MCADTDHAISRANIAGGKSAALTCNFMDDVEFFIGAQAVIDLTDKEFTTKHSQKSATK